MRRVILRIYGRVVYCVVSKRDVDRLHGICCIVRICGQATWYMLYRNDMWPGYMVYVVS